MSVVGRSVCRVVTSLPTTTQPEDPALAVQPSLLADGPALHAVDFVVVDLETTGGAATGDRITEIGAVRVRGGEVLGELGTLVNPGRAIPPTITVLTGITDAMVVAAPSEEEVVPTFLEFARDAVLVAHNARFDVGFLRAACDRLGIEWPRPLVVDTLALARRVVTRDEAPNHKLGSLARLFHAAVAPDHRALTDARATVDVLHGLLARLAPLGVTHLDDLVTAADPVPEAVRRKATLADGLPQLPGVYQFLDASDRILYVGTATNLRTRVRSYFTAAEKRRRITEMVRIAARVHPIPVPTPLEASVRELRLIAQHSPPYNRRSRSPGAEPWIRLTDEAFPRASIVRAPPASGPVLGPFRSRGLATAALEALTGAFGLRSCTERLPLSPRPGHGACALRELGRCGAPCVGDVDRSGYLPAVEAFTRFAAGDAREYLAHAAARLDRLVAQERFEEAAVERDRCQALLRGAARAQHLRALRCAELLAARPRDDARSTTGRGSGGARTGGRVWEVVCIRHGRLAGTAVAASTAAVLETAEALRLTAEDVPEPTTLAGAAWAEEAELLWGWLDRPGVRLLAVEGAALALPRHGAAWALADLQRHLGLTHPRVLVEAEDPEQVAGRSDPEPTDPRHETGENGETDEAGEAEDERDGREAGAA
ncbi:MAG: DEDD exonuclease domain-containing protein [Salana multivorans]|nr:DEDD exonuclease domain-containing protein [Salana multivorans]